MDITNPQADQPGNDTSSSEQDSGIRCRGEGNMTDWSKISFSVANIEAESSRAVITSADDAQQSTQPTSPMGESMVEQLRQTIRRLEDERIIQQRLSHDHVVAVEKDVVTLKASLDDATARLQSTRDELAKVTTKLTRELNAARDKITMLEKQLHRARLHGLVGASLFDPTADDNAGNSTGGWMLPQDLLQHTQPLSDANATEQWHALEAEVNALVGTFITHRIAWYRLNRGAKDLLEMVTPHYDEAEEWDPDRAEDWSEHWRAGMLQGCIWRVIHSTVFEGKAGFWAGEESTHLDRLLEGLYKLHRHDWDALCHFNKVRVSLIPYIKPLTNDTARAEALNGAAEHVTAEFYRLIQTGTYRDGHEDLTPFKLAFLRVLKSAVKLRDVFVRSPASWMPVFPKPLGRSRRIDRRMMEVTDPIPLADKNHDHERSESAAARGAVGCSGGGTGEKSYSGGGGSGNWAGSYYRGRKRCVKRVAGTSQGLVKTTGDGVQPGDKDVWVAAVITPALLRYGGADGHWMTGEGGRGMTVIKSRVICLPILPDEDEESDDNDEGGGDRSDNNRSQDKTKDSDKNQSKDKDQNKEQGKKKEKEVGRSAAQEQRNDKNPDAGGGGDGGETKKKPATSRPKNTKGTTPNAEPCITKANNAAPSQLAQKSKRKALLDDVAISTFTAKASDTCKDPVSENPPKRIKLEMPAVGMMMSTRRAAATHTTEPTEAPAIANTLQSESALESDANKNHRYTTARSSTIGGPSKQATRTTTSSDFLNPGMKHAQVIIAVAAGSRQETKAGIEKLMSSPPVANRTTTMTTFTDKEKLKRLDRIRQHREARVRGEVPVIKIDDD